VETERRLKALEAEMEGAELHRRERQLAVKYHKVKFFGTCLGTPLPLYT
jgi:hypothetical protein